MSNDEKRILLVEDDEEISATFAELLRDEGYDVSCATDGRQAISQLQSTEKLPGLILLDLMMPNMDGFEFRDIQRREPTLSAIPVVLMTACGDTEAKARQLDAQGYLQKPFKNIETALESIAAFFGH